MFFLNAQETLAETLKVLPFIFDLALALFVLRRTQRPEVLFVFNLIYIDSIKSRK